MSEGQKETIYNYDVNGNRYRCVGDRIIIRPLGVMVRKLGEAMDLTRMTEADLKTIALEYWYKGEVIFVGDGITSGIEMNPPQVNVGDIVFYDRKCDTVLRIDAGNGMEDLLIIREANCHFIQEKPVVVEAVVEEVEK
jgi:co-chaperonin GroES (HSP10)